jgi:NADP-dependent 3-hydroxy acid dehydrogenase YdfG
MNETSQVDIAEYLQLPGAHETAGIDILVNNAGDIPGGSIEKIDDATWRHANRQCAQ